MELWAERASFRRRFASALVRLVLQTQEQHVSEWAALVSLATKIDCTPESLRKWQRRAQVDSGERAGTTTSERE